MKLRRQVELAITELPDELQFRVVRELGLLDWIYPIAGVTVVLIFLRLVVSWHRVSDGGVAGLWVGICLAEFLNLRRKGPEYHLTVGRNRLSATEGLRGRLSNKLEIAAQQVDSLRWVPGGLQLSYNDKPLICVLPGLTREQVHMLVEAIESRFPMAWERYCHSATPVFGNLIGIRPISPPAPENELQYASTESTRSGSTIKNKHLSEETWFTQRPAVSAAISLRRQNKFHRTLNPNLW
jgi:hypothetical protein